MKFRKWGRPTSSVKGLYWSRCSRGVGGGKGKGQKFVMMCQFDDNEGWFREWESVGYACFQGCHRQFCKLFRGLKGLFGGPIFEKSLQICIILCECLVSCKSSGKSHKFINQFKWIFPGFNKYVIFVTRSLKSRANSEPRKHIQKIWIANCFRWHQEEQLF